MTLVIPRHLQEKLGADGTEELLKFIHEEQTDAKVELRKDYLGEDEKRELRIEIKIEEVRGSLEKRIDAMGFNLLKWIIAMWISLIIAMGIFKYL